MIMCDAKIRPLPNDTEVECGLPGDHYQHEGVLEDYAYPGSRTTISWLEQDRRNFRGDWHPCTSPGCVLPAVHHGAHAV